jgi:hypothetical protein
LFGYLNGEMPGFIADLPAGILSEMCRIFQKISKVGVIGVMADSASSTS